ncbi:hypothetical protein BRW65_00790 [Mycobacterium paraffinicum]|uniref:Uncharacterized protein n=1 Tax=Mycobacterium paraffinicum TaxID=53378 RepID=A0A1Q4I282_9MYCO|nr:hypothetical protein [Mycobacterium paraffinicum]OJZ76025.1 hypothetical protein BRW65_00790 [Mycobacterium paraffinicum]
MVDDQPVAPHDDYDLLTQYEAGKRLTDDIERERRLCDDLLGAEGEVHRLRLSALEDAARRHRECRPADRPTFFNAAGVVERVRTAK